MREIVGNTIATPNPQPDWTQTDQTKADFIKNKPTVLTEDQVKDLIDEFGGDTQIQVDWTQTDTSAKDYIKNKPTLGALASKDGVAKSDLSVDVQTALDNANSALQSYTETDPTVPDWAKAKTKPIYTALEVGAIPTSAKGVANGVATLGTDGLVPSSQLPLDVVEGTYNKKEGKFYKNESTGTTTEIKGENGKIYVDIGGNKIYRWSETYKELAKSYSLGDGASDAYPGNKGKDAYEHSQMKSDNPHGVTLSDLGVTVTADQLNTMATLSVATTSQSGLMSATDKANLDALVASAITVLSGTTEPTSDMGKDGDLYLVLEG